MLRIRPSVPTFTSRLGAVFVTVLMKFTSPELGLQTLVLERHPRRRRDRLHELAFGVESGVVESRPPPARRHARRIAPSAIRPTPDLPTACPGRRPSRLRRGHGASRASTRFPGRDPGVRPRGRRARGLRGRAPPRAGTRRTGPVSYGGSEEEGERHRRERDEEDELEEPGCTVRDAVERMTSPTARSGVAPTARTGHSTRLEAGVAVRQRR